MKISLNIVLDLLKPYNLESYININERHYFSTCLHLSDKLDKPIDSCLYIGKLSKALSLRSSGANFFCLCIRDRVKDEIETDNSLANFIIINENISLTTIINQVQLRFFAVSDWIQKMQETLIRGGSLQELVDVGASLIDNHINITDASLMLMAHSRFIPCDDPITLALVEYGYHPEESIQKFRKNDLFSLWQKEDKIYLDDTLITAKYPAYNKIFKFRDTYFAHIVMTCNRHAPSPGLVDLFQLFLDILNVHIERTWEAKSSSNHIYDSLLFDLLEGKITNKSVIEERAQYVDVAVTGRFCLFQIVSNDAANMSIGKMLMEFADLFPRIKFIRYKQRIVAINQFQDRDDIDEQLRTICLSLENFLLKYDAMCSVSSVFSSLDEITFAYYQSSLTFDYTKRLNGQKLCESLNLIETSDSRIHYFDNTYLMCLLGEGETNSELWYHSKYHQMLGKLCEHDRQHKTNTLQILNIYLNKERSATETGVTLSMHRNNVLYHIGRIKELLGIDLDDTNTRLMMQLSFTLLKLFGFKKA